MRTTCFRGHEFVPENTYEAPDGSRECKTCQRDRARANYHGNKLSRPTDEDRFWAFVEKIGDPNHKPSGEYWKWIGSKTRGYGYFSFGGGKIQAYRYSYTKLVGEIPEGLDLDHLCRVRDCVNPLDLEAVTRSTNIQRGLNGSLRIPNESCVNGHTYTEENRKYVFNGEYRTYRCKECLREQRHERYLVTGR